MTSSVVNGTLISGPPGCAHRNSRKSDQNVSACSAGRISPRHRDRISSDIFLIAVGGPASCRYIEGSPGAISTASGCQRLLLASTIMATEERISGDVNRSVILSGGFGNTLKVSSV